MSANDKNRKFVYHMVGCSSKYVSQEPERRLKNNVRLKPITDVKGGNFNFDKSGCLVSHHVDCAYRCTWLELFK